jgi:phosphoribosylaminoimidazolecarboxamide formyltransferase/IMP cyclohydrolase
VVCNLYPFSATVASGASAEDCIEKIDIGGPSMIRAAAKNHGDVFVVTDPSDYTPLLDALRAGGAAVGLPLRRRLAWKAFAHCAAYDANVAEWFWAAGGARGEGESPFPPQLSVPLRLADTLRYGENPHQAAAFYTETSLAEAVPSGVATATLHHGKEMSYNNYLDCDAAYGTVCDFAEPSCVVVKHTNPCGVASRTDLLEAYRLAVIADPISAFGGIVAFNRPVDAALAKEIREFRSPTDGETRMFYEIVIAPGYTPDGLEVLKGKSKTLRILEAAPRPRGGRVLRQVGGGFLYQGTDDLTPEDITFTVVSEAQPSAAQLADLRFAWRCVKHVKSNAITVAANGRLLGMGSGQPNRVKSTEIALEKAGADVAGAVLASDAFFPFSWGDSVEKACQAGIKAIAHPGGSIRDQDAVDCCNKYGAHAQGRTRKRMCMHAAVSDCACVFAGVVLCTTGHRHFRH